jgi:hypothetical protein
MPSVSSIVSSKCGIRQLFYLSFTLFYSPFTPVMFNVIRFVAVFGYALFAQKWRNDEQFKSD